MKQQIIKTHDSGNFCVFVCNGVKHMKVMRDESSFIGLKKDYAYLLMKDEFRAAANLNDFAEQHFDIA